MLLTVITNEIRTVPYLNNYAFLTIPLIVDLRLPAPQPVQRRERDHVCVGQERPAHRPPQGCRLKD